MRPHRLVLAAFGPFGETIDVDFDSLAPAGLFHIHGPTGAGKTALLDGVCFALYGDVPGARHRDSLRSDHATDDLDTRAVLDFSLPGSRYRVERTARRTRPKRRGSGTTIAPETAVLWRRDGDRWVVVSEHRAEVDAMVFQLLGLNAAQFQRVVLLPQGRFADALLASTEERRRLLRTLFGTARFAEATEQLGLLAQASEAEASTQRRRLSSLVERAVRRAEEVKVLAVDADPPELGLTGLAVIHDRVIGEARAAAVEREHAEAVSCRASQMVVEAEARAELDERRGQAERVMNELSVRDQAIAAIDQRVVRANAAGPVVVLLDAHDEERSRATLEATAAGELVAQANEELRQAGMLDTAHGALSPGVRSVAELVGALVGAIGPHAEVTGDGDGLTTPLAEASRSAEHLSSILDAAADTLREAMDLRKRGAARAETASEAAALASVLGERLAQLGIRSQRVDHELSVACDARSRLPGLISEADRRRRASIAAAHIEEAERLASDARVAADTAEVAAEEASVRLLDLLRRRACDTAEQLAASLQDGVPCSVCGSTVHPRPAASPTPPEPVDAGRLIAAADRRAQATARKAKRLRAVAITATGEHDKIRYTAGLTTDDDAPRAPDVATLHLEAKEAEATLSSARADASRVDRLIAEQRDLAAQRTDDEAALVRARGQAASAGALADQDEDQARSLIREALIRAGRPPTDPGSKDQVSPDGVSLMATVEELETERDVMITVAQLLSEAASAHTRSLGASQRATELGAKAAECLDKAGFRHVADARLAFVDESEVEALAQQVETHRRLVAAAEAVLAALGPSETGPAPDPAQCREAGRIASTQCERAMARHSLLQAAATEIGRLLDEYRRLDAESGPLVQRAELSRMVADVCRGAGNGRHQALETYVLAAFCEEVTGVATARLLSMSGGRFALEHTDERQTGHRSAGLDLAVLDHWTGRRREPGTLSGGELFQASLALALAMAEVVQRHAGGIAIDTLFVDEGFGSLDPDALELALDELDGLRAGGRLVGVISHVPALRERISVGIAVHAGSRGSTATVDVAPVLVG